MNSNPLDFPNWMEDSQAARPASDTSVASGSASAPGAGVSATPASKAATATGPLAASTASTGGTAANSPLASTPSGPASGKHSSEALRNLSHVETERRQVMASLDSWARTWAEVEKRNAQCVEELSRFIERLTQEQAQSDLRQRDVEQRASEQAARHELESKDLHAKIGELEPYVQLSKDLSSKCSAVGQELATTRTALEQQKRETEALDERCETLTSEAEKLKDHLTRSQEATREATMREQDWQSRYHEDTGKLMQQLTTKIQECERWISENQKQKGEIDRQTRELRSKDEVVQTLSLRCSDLDRRSTTQQAAIEERDARIAELAQQLAELQKEVEAHKAAEEEHSSMLQAAQGVLAELQPKLMQLEKRLHKH